MSKEVSAVIDPAELHFLILHYLSAGPCAAAAKLLEQEASKGRLLPSRHDILGNEHKLSYSDLQRKYADIHPDALPSLLQHALAARQVSTSLDLQGDRSLLVPGFLNTSSSHHIPAAQTQTAHSVHHKLALQQQGHVLSSLRGDRILSAEQHVAHMQHHKTVRGHKLAVYCIAFDKAGRHVITGSDDRLIKIWSAATAQLLRSCRGHDGEVTDLAVNLDSTIVASSSNDTTIRCWSLQRDTLGHPVSVLTGHQGPVTYVDFNKANPNALLSSSYDGSCRIWDAASSGQAAHVMQASASFGPMKGVTRFGGTAGLAMTGQGNRPLTRQEVAEAVAAEASTIQNQGQPASSPGLLVCGFSPDGSHIVAGSNDCHIYAWHWDIASAMDKGKAAAKQSTYNVASEEDAARNLATAVANVPDVENWPEPQEMCRLGGHVNDVLLLQFSHDGQSIATGSKDGTVRTWQRVRRRHKMLHSWENRHVLKCELDDAVVRKARQRRRAPPSPSVKQLAWSHDDMMVVSSVSDHTIRAWNAETGQEAQRLMGHEGPVHILECHPLHHHLVMSASYDGTTRLWNLHTGKMLHSFSSQATRPDIHGSWTEHIQLVDGHWSPCGDSLVVSDVAGQWHMYSLGPPDLVRHARYDQFLEADYDRLTRDLNNAVIDDNTQLPPHLRPSRDHLVDYMQVRYAEPYQAAYLSDSVLQLPLAVAQGLGEWDTTGLPQALREYPPTVTAAAWMAQEAEGTEEDIDRAVQRALQRAIAAEASLAAAVVAGEVTFAADSEVEQNEEQQQHPAEPQQEGAVARQGAQRRRLHRGNRPDMEDVGGDDNGNNSGDGEVDEWEQWPDEDAEISSSDEDKAASDSGDSVYEEAGAGPQTRAQRQERRRQKRQRPHQGQQAQHSRKRRRLRNANYTVDVSDDEDELDDLEEEYSEPGNHASRPRRRAAPIFGADRKGRKQKKKAEAKQRAGKARSGSAARQAENYAWLQVRWRVPGVYVPQLGDDVVYLTVGHQKFWTATNNKLQGPWDNIVNDQAAMSGHSMREVEPAKVVALEYSISNDGTSNTVARVDLQLSDATSPLVGHAFQVDLPPPNCGHAEFVVPQHRFMTAIQRRWACSNACQAFYPDDEEAAAVCEAWHGVITAVCTHAEPAEEDAVQADPYSCGGLWERFQVQWQTDPQDTEAAGSSGNSEDSQPSLQSPWELFDADLDPQQAAQEGPQLDPLVANRLKQAVDALMAWEQFEVFVDLLDPSAAYPADSGAMLFYNATVALPVSLSLIKDRLEQSYYRQTEGFLGDVDTLANNARDFNGNDSPVGLAAADLAQRLRAAAAGERFDEASESEDAEISDASQAADMSEEDDVDIMNSPGIPNSPGTSSPNHDLPQAWAQQNRRSARVHRPQHQPSSSIPEDGTAVLRRHGEPGQGSSLAEEGGKDANQEVAEQHHGRRTRSRHFAAQEVSLAAGDTPKDEAQHHGRRSARLQVMDQQKQNDELQQQRQRQQQAAVSVRDNAASSRTRRALARSSRLAHQHSTWDHNTPAADEVDEDVGAGLFWQDMTAPTVRRTRAQHISSMPEHSRLSTPEPPEQASDVHNTGHALRRSHRKHASSPSVAGPAPIDRPEEAPQAISSGIRVTLRTLRPATRQEDQVHAASNSNQALPGRHNLRFSLRSRQ